MPLPLTTLQRALADRWQRDLPLVPRPFAAIAASVGVTERDVLKALASMAASGVLSRVGPVFRPGALGASTLAAMAVPAERLDAVAHQVSRRPEVNHNYEREHRLNLWFVVTANGQAHLRATLDDIARTSELPVLSLPLVEAYHIDLGFALDHGETAAEEVEAAPCALGLLNMHEGERADACAGDISATCDCAALSPPTDSALIAAVQDGLPIVPQPFLAAGATAGLSESATIARLGDWIADGTIRRLGLVLRHRSLGYDANAMVVWDVPDEAVASLGARLAREPGVTLCYRRARAFPRWRYNLYCMLHGRERPVVADRIAGLVHRQRIDHYPREVLFSRTAFKQRGARYRFDGSDGAPARG